MEKHIQQVVDLTDPANNAIDNMSLEEARQSVLTGPAEGLVWANRSLDLAFEVGATVACLIPTRAGNGALEALASRGLFTPPRLAALEAAAEYGIRRGRARVFVDLWDLERFSGCPSCFPARAERLWQMNLDQVIPGRIQCTACG